MPKQRVKVEFVGLLPTFFNTVASCCTLDYLQVAGLTYKDEQLKEYPPEVVEVQNRAAELYARIMRDFGDRVVPIAVGLTSLRGLWLALKYRLGRGLTIVIDGQKAISGEADYEVVKKAIEEAFGRPEQSPAEGQGRGCFRPLRLERGGCGDHGAGKVEILEPVIVRGFPRGEDFEALDRLAATISEEHKKHNFA